MTILRSLWRLLLLCIGLFALGLIFVLSLLIGPALRWIGERGAKRHPSRDPRIVKGCGPETWWDIAVRREPGPLEDEPIYHAGSTHSKTIPGWGSLGEPML